ncbi:Cytochrome P450 2J2 [Dryobates pubescens]|uniref:Cytochrome P450 2J2 n=1 Tax=Dryobates pubescens TaxID=118200 RepID=A0A093GNL8_DRYPU|nr:Cytochrome P450 2J2 [Dryobates pubescens]
MLLLLWDSISFQMLLIFLTVFLLVADYLKRRKPKNYPPSPLALPFIGHLYLLDLKDPTKAMQKLTEKYGDIFNIDMGSTSFLLVSGQQLIKEVLVNKGEDFIDRPDFPIEQYVFSSKGLISSNGLLWKQQRRFALSTLRTFGLGKRSLEERIQEECRYLVDAFGEEQGSPFNPHFQLTNAVSNIICSITFGNRFEYHDEDFQKLLHLLEETVRLHGTIAAQLYPSFPTIMKLLPGSHQTILKNWKVMKGFVMERIERHKEAGTPSESRDFIDSYLQEMAKGDSSKIFQEENLVACVLDLLFAGTETTSTTLRWALLYMTLHPEIQARVQSEIDVVIGQMRQPALEDRDKMPYTNAVIHEVQRIGNIIPFNVPRAPTKDTVVGGYTIPKGTFTVISLSSLMFDKNEWETPHTFNPGHFLKDGQFQKRELFIPFSMGKRACLGEVMARSELFLFFTALLQKFTFQPPPGTTYSLKPKLGITMAPEPYKICAVPR